MALIGFSRVMSRITTEESSSMRSMMLVVPTFRNVAYSLMLESPTMTCKPAVTLGVGVGLVAGVDYRPAPGRGRRDAFPDMLSPLANAVLRAPRRLQDLSGPGVNLAGNEERDQHFRIMREVVPPRGQVVLVAAIRVARPSPCCF